MFAYYFPPLGGSGVQRTLKYVKYLPEHGFEPLVVTGRPRWATQLADESLLSEVPPSATRGPKLRRSRSTTSRARSTASWAASGSPAGWCRGALWPDHARGLDPRRGMARAEVNPRARAVDPLQHVASGDLAPRRPDRSPSSPVCPGSPISATRSRTTRIPCTPTTTRPIAYTRPWSAGLWSGRCTRPSPATASACPDSAARIGDVGTYPTGSTLKTSRRTSGPRPVPLDRFRLSYVGTLYGARNAGPVFDAVRTLVQKGSSIPIASRSASWATRSAHRPMRCPSPSRSPGSSIITRLSPRCSARQRSSFIPPRMYRAHREAVRVLDLGSSRAMRREPQQRRLPHRRRARGWRVRGRPRSGKRRGSAHAHGHPMEAGGLPPLEDVRREAIKRFSRAKLAGDLAELLRSALSEDGAALRPGPTP